MINPQQGQKKRYNFVFGFIGVNRSGKSVTARKIADSWRLTRDPNRFKIVSFDPQARFRDITDYFIDIEDEDYCIKLSKTKRKLVILDDLRLKSESDTPPKGLRSLLINRAENNVDIMYICHNPADVFNSLCRLTTHWFIFPVSEQDGGFKKKIPCYAECKAAANKVNDYVRDIDTTKLYPNFPYVVVTERTKKIQAYNFDTNINRFRK